MNENLNIYNIFKSRLSKLKVDDFFDCKMNYEGDQLRCELEYLEEGYSIYENKLSCIKRIESFDKEKQAESLNNIKRIFELENFTEIQKMVTVISYGALLDNFSYINDRSFEEIVMLSVASRNLLSEDYIDYMAVISDEVVSKSIIQKSEKLSDRLNVAYNIMDSIDNCNVIVDSKENYNFLINNALEVVNNYEISCKQNNK